MSETHKPPRPIAPDQESALQLFASGRLPLPPGAASANGASAVPAITLSVVLHAVRRWWKLATPFALLFGALAGAAVWYFFVPLFQSSRLIQIKDNTPYIAFQQGGGESTRFARTEMTMIRSRLVLDHVVERPEIAGIEELRSAESPVEWIASRLRMGPVGGSEFYSVSFEGPNPDHTQLIVEAVIEEYTNLRSQRGGESSEAMKRLLDDELARRKEELERLEQAVREAAMNMADDVNRDRLIFPSVNSIVQVPGQFTQLQSLRTNLDFERSMLKVRREALDAELKGLEIEIEEETVEQVLGQDSKVLAIQQLIAQAEMQLQRRQGTGAQGFPDPRVKALQASLEGYGEELAKRQDELRPLIRERIEEKIRAEREQRIAEIDEQIKGKDVMEEMLLKRIDGYREKMDGQSAEWWDLEFAKADLAQARGVHDRITQRLEAMQTEAAAPGRIDTNFPAAERGTPSKEHKIPRIILASAAGFGFPFFLAVLWEMKTRRIGASDEIPSETPVEVIGELSELPTRPSRLRLRSSHQYNYYRNTFEESVDYLRTSLLLSDQFREMRVVAIASAVSQEGKTSLASHLAVSVARATKEPTLLIDADMRNPGINELFDVNLSPGLADLLDGQTSFDEAVTGDSVPHLHILPAGELSKSPHVLLGNGALRSVVDEARRRYRYVIVDSPPVLPVSDALVIAKTCDGTLISTMRDVSRGPQVRRACERLKSAGAHLIGAVLSGVPPQTYSSRYGPYAYSYQRNTSHRTPPTTTHKEPTS